ncbi:TetR/AcrR family transcriptional regulator [Isoptericola sp. AK164]|uniref:TetR/AcrR family transcriptional regulator n=1 Tax=Isoptericola sp. AK164 TaxID=3024246 RepID=UPI0024183B7A|nr:TetR/AcrR family transcriptional regulator [Isoptericola sp. AK164]
MDPRQERTRSSLRSAVLDLAAHRPVGSLSVTEVARAAGITRDTFYRHAASPVELLATVLEEELRRIDPPTRGGADEFVRAETRLLQHVAARREIYRRALVEGAEGRVRQVLQAVLAARLGEYLQDHPQDAPAVPDGLGDDVTREILVAYSAAGTVEAITAWLRAGGDEDDIPALARTIVAVGPPSWNRPVGRTP